MSVSISFARGIATVENRVWNHEDEATAALLNALTKPICREWLESHSAEQHFSDFELAKLVAKEVDGVAAG